MDEKIQMSGFAKRNWSTPDLRIQPIDESAEPSDFNFIDPSSVPPLVNIGLVALFPDNSSPDELAESLHKLDVPIHVAPRVGQLPSAYITNYIYPVLYKGNGRPGVLISHLIRDLHRRSFMIQLNEPSGTIELLDDQKKAFVTVTPYTITFNNENIELHYEHDGPVITTPDDVPPAGVLNNPRFATRISRSESNIMDVIPFSIVSDWLPEKAYTKIHDVIDQRDSVVATTICGANLKLLYASIGHTVRYLRVTDAESFYAGHLDETNGDTTNISTVSDFIETLLSRRKNGERSYAMPLGVKQPTGAGHAICLFANVERVPGAPGQIKQTIVIFDSNGHAKTANWRTELKTMLKHIYELLDDSHIHVSVKTSTYRFQIVEYRWLTNTMKNDKQMLRHESEGGRCQTWAAYALYLFERYVQKQKCTIDEMLAKLKALPMQTAYQLVTMYGEYLLDSMEEYHPSSDDNGDEKKTL